MVTLALIDPLTLAGREVLRVLPRFPSLSGRVVYLHTAEDDEHQIAELAGDAALVPPVDDPDELAEVDAVVIASEEETPRLEALARHLRDRSEMPSVFLTPPPSVAVDLGTAVPGQGAVWPARTAHPAALMARDIAAALQSLQPEGGTLAAVDPVSSLGVGAIDVLVRQAVARLNGEIPKETLAGHVVAFGMATTPTDRIAEDAAAVVRGVALAVSSTLAGCFHGHVLHLGLAFAEPVDHVEVEELLTSSSSLEVARGPINLDQVPDLERILVGDVQLAPGGRFLTLTAMVDGLRLSAQATLQLLEEVVIAPS